MANYTEHLNLYEVNPKTDGNMTFNIDSMLNDNWDKLDAYASKMDGMLSNENLLINWDFRNPVNTRGQQEYTATGTTVDGWYMLHPNGSVVVNDGIVLTGTRTDFSAQFRQYLDSPKSLSNQTVTLSFVAKADSNSGFAGISRYIHGDINVFENLCELEFTNTTFEILTKTIILPVLNFDDKLFVNFRTPSDSTGQLTVQKVKLELGSVSTLKNDPPANRAEQENLCVRFGRDGNLITGPLYCNTNLLINADFRNPVNQKGQSEYTGATYTVDMWQLNVDRGKLTVNDGYVTLTNTAASGAEYLRQGFERVFKTGDTLTLSAEIRGNGSGQLFLGSSTDGANIGGATSYTATSDWQTITFTKTLESTLPKWWVIQTTGQNTYIDIRRVKLEYGPVSTLQNDPPQDYGVELLKCQRYQLILQSNQVRATTVRANDIGFMVPTSVQMRDTPSISINNLKVVSMDGKGQEGFTFSVSSRRSNGVYIVAAKTSHGLKDAFLLATNNDTNADTLLDANL